MLIKKIYKLILDLIFPCSCLNCKKEGEWLCRDCLKAIKPYQNQSCAICGKRSVTNPCPFCQKETKIKKLIIRASYDQKIVADLVHIYKYNFAQEIGEILTKLILEQTKIKNLSGFTFVPVPLHKKRFSWREFNQATLIAQHLSNTLKLPLKTNLLIRTKNTKPQAQIKDVQKRRANIKGAFKANPKKNLPARVILVDDIGTTFGTLSECARQLHKAGVKEIWGLVFAKG